MFASEINAELQDIYYKNFGVQPAGDIKTVRESDIPQHEILCAGFPCQPFSLAERKQGQVSKFREADQRYFKNCKISFS